MTALFAVLFSARATESVLQVAAENAAELLGAPPDWTDRFQPMYRCIFGDVKAGAEFLRFSFSTATDIDYSERTDTLTRW
jgi:hypothetical protein